VPCVLVLDTQITHVRTNNHPVYDTLSGCSKQNYARKPLLAHHSTLKLSIPISATNLIQGNNFVRLGIPLSRGLVHQCENLKISDPQKDSVAASFTPAATWADGSIKWCQAELIIESDNATDKQLTLQIEDNCAATHARWHIIHSDQQVKISDSDTTYTFWPQQSVIATMIGESTGNYQFDIQRFNIDSTDSLAIKCSYLVRLSDQSGHRLNATFNFELLPDAQLNIAIELHNPKRVQHRGGIWDLGDLSSNQPSMQPGYRQNLNYPCFKRPVVEKTGTVRYTSTPKMKCRTVLRAINSTTQAKLYCKATDQNPHYLLKT